MTLLPRTMWRRRRPPPPCQRGSCPAAGAPGWPRRRRGLVLTAEALYRTQFSLTLTSKEVAETSQTMECTVCAYLILLLIYVCFSLICSLV